MLKHHEDKSTKAVAYTVESKECKTNASEYLTQETGKQYGFTVGQLEGWTVGWLECTF